MSTVVHVLIHVHQVLASWAHHFEALACFLSIPFVPLCLCLRNGMAFSLLLVHGLLMLPLKYLYFAAWAYLHLSPFCS